MTGSVRGIERRWPDFWPSWKKMPQRSDHYWAAPVDSAQAQELGGRGQDITSHNAPQQLPSSVEQAQGRARGKTGPAPGFEDLRNGVYA